MLGLRTLRSICRNSHLQRRWYADAPAGDQMKFTFAGANQVNTIFKKNNTIKIMKFN